MEVTSNVPASATVTLAAVQVGLLVIDPWEVASLSKRFKSVLLLFSDKEIV
jgi:hypothetical protein